MGGKSIQPESIIDMLNKPENPQLTAVEPEVLTQIVGRVLRISDITLGDDRRAHYLVRYRGQLYGEAEQAYDQLAANLRPYDITPLFRPTADEAQERKNPTLAPSRSNLQNDPHTILLLRGVIRPQPSNAWINLLLFLLTLVSMIFTGALFAYDGPPLNSREALMSGVLSSLGPGLAFAASLLAILLAHEFGHYLAARYHKTAVTLPYFLPFPFSAFGTMGAFIRLKEPPRNKRILLDIGLAGPLAGLVVAIPVLLLGLALSQVSPIEMNPGEGFTLEGNSLIYLASKYLVFGQLLPAPASYDGLNPVLYWIRYFFTGQPLPLGGLDVMIHPVAWAGWAGLLVTALNLIPAGQLDGGHVLYVLAGRRARLLWPVVLAALIGLGFVWNGWWLWAGIIFFMGRVYAKPLDSITTLDPGRRLVALLGIVVFILVFTPVPLIAILGG